MFGQRVPRVEDPRLLAGRGRYLDDLGKDALAAAFVRSPHAHAKIVDIDVTAALDIDGLVAVYTFDDLDGRTTEALPLLIPHPTLTHGRTPHALAKGEVNHVGEAIVMVVATDRYVAEDAAALIDVTYDFLPAVVGIETAREAADLAMSPPPWCRRSVTLRRRSRPRRATARCRCRSSAARRCRWRARACSPAGTRTTSRCSCTRPRRPRPACARPSPPS
jgi:CO/xanthine dehydrogenase Mo-binding subunit